ncbi:MAG: uncharacterized protein KVP18_003105 [Porospora cf. gigantea A]|nr:MAG: hypothetical protein KVP18_003105 [Porospora cf. gigantea A]
MLDLSPMLDELDADCIVECNIRWYLSEVSRVACAIGCLYVFETYRSAWELLKTFYPTSLSSALSELVELTRYVPLFETLTAEDLSRIDFHVLDRQKMISLIRPGRHHYNASYKSAFLSSFESTGDVNEAGSSACVWLDNIRMLECAPVDLSDVFRSAYQFIVDYESSPAQSEADAGQAAFIHALEAVQRSCVFLDIVQPKKILQVVHQHFLPDFSAAAKACTQVCTLLPVASDTNVAPRVHVYLHEYLAAFRRSVSPTAAHHEAVEKTTEMHRKRRGIGLV